MNLKRIQVNVKYFGMYQDEFHLTNGFEIAPGLSIVPGLRKENGKIISRRGHWSILHNASGIGVLHGFSKEDAINGAFELAPLIDWTNSDSKDLVNKLLADKDIMKVITKLRGLQK